MKNTFAILVCVLSVVIFSAAKTKRKTVLLPLVQANQVTVQASDKENESALLVREGGNAFNISAGMIAGDAVSGRLVLTIINASQKSRIFAPEEIVVMLRNGHSYHPFSRVDVLAQAYEAKADPKGRKAPPTRAAFKETSYTATCSIDSGSTDCPTTPDVSMQAWYARKLALVAIVRNALHNRKFKKYVEEVKHNYLESQDIAPGETVSGYVDAYVEDIGKGPFTVRVAGNTTWSAPAPGQLAIPKVAYDFRFRPNVVGDPE